MISLLIARRTNVSQPEYFKHPPARIVSVVLIGDAPIPRVRVEGSATSKYIWLLRTTTFPPATAPASAGLLLPSFSLWWREIVRFYRQRARVVGVIASPLLFWIVIGSGFGTSFRSNGPPAASIISTYFFPGALIMIVLFTAIFTMMSVIEDRKEGFLLSVLVAPVSRSVIVLGKVLGGATLATLQGLIFLVFAPALGVHFTLASFGLTVLTIFLVAFSLTALGFIIAWPMDSTQAFHAIINLFLIPLWLLSGSLFPLSGASIWIRAG